MKNDSERRLKCRACSEAFPIGPMFIGCPRCKQYGRIGALEVDYDYGALRSKQISTGWKNAKGLWSYSDLLPLPTGHDPISMAEGNTPLVKLEATGTRIWIKDETRNPTGAHKDRFHSVSISMARYFGMEKVCAATTGNHGFSLAAYAARARLSCLVFCDVRSPQVLRTAMQVFGARVAVLPNRSQFLEWLVKDLGWYPSTGMTPSPVATPYGVEGYKTIAYEVYVSLGNRMPKAVVIPVAGGDILYGIWKGFCELRLLGADGDLPRMYAVQAAGCDPIARGFNMRATSVPVHPSPETIAISIADPTASPITLETLYASQGSAEVVSDEEIIGAMRMLAAHGILVEPAGAAALAAVAPMKAAGKVSEGDDIVVVATGAGIKWPEQLRAAADSHYLEDEDPRAIQAWLGSVDMGISGARK